MNVAPGIWATNKHSSSDYCGGLRDHSYKPTQALSHSVCPTQTFIHCSLPPNNNPPPAALMWPLRQRSEPEGQTERSHDFTDFFFSCCHFCLSVGKMNKTYVINHHEYPINSPVFYFLFLCFLSLFLSLILFCSTFKQCDAINNLKKCLCWTQRPILLPPLPPYPCPLSLPRSLPPLLCSFSFLSCLLSLCLNGEAGFSGTCTPLAGCRTRCWGSCCQDGGASCGWGGNICQLQAVLVCVCEALATSGLQRGTLSRLTTHRPPGE